MAACSESRNPYFKAFVVVAIETAMRRGEMLSLRRQHIDFEARTAFLPDTKNGYNRTIPLSNQAILQSMDIQPHISGRVFPISVTALRG